ncbi:MAG: TonB-dependent receptor [Dysgonamonadaceae bacterium]|jgi:TonB-linked SusC/RagA family outer membrane protein|nr:TonB-dependent receptor [Dysgonamonadaceae bacterium]
MKQKTILNLKQIFLLMLSGLFSVTAVYGESVSPVYQENISLEELFAQIEQQSDYVFLVAGDAKALVKQKITRPASLIPVSEIMDRVLKGTGLACKIVDRQISVYMNPLAKADKRESQQPAQAAAIRVTGKVMDDFNNGITGVSVVVRGTLSGTNTDINGEFSISVPSDTCVLLFSYLGYQTEEVKVGNNRILAVTLREKAESLDEVVVVAFGKQKKESVVSSIETVNVKDLKIPSSNLTTAFAGKIPGIISYSTSGEPGADNAKFFVRGVTTFGYKADPLILIDGFEATSNDLARLPPDDIESFSIFKDASATVLYGARGANGIISVNTKRGLEGPLKVSARFDMNVSSPTQMLELLDGVSYMRLYNDARISRDADRIRTANETSQPLGAWYSEEKIQATLRGENPMIYPNIDWYDMLFKKQTVNTKANINLQSGGKIGMYYVSAGYDHETGLLNVNGMNNYNNNIDINRFNLRTNVIFKLSSTTTLDTRISGRFERYNGPYNSATSIFNMVMDANPVDFPATWIPDERYKNIRFPLFGNTDPMKSNPYAEMVRGYEERNENTISAQATLMQDLDMLVKGLKLQLKASINTWTYSSGRRTVEPLYFALEQYDRYTDTYSLYRLNPNASGYLGDVQGGRDGNTHYYYEARANWDRKFGRHNLGLMTVCIAEEYVLSNGNGGSIYETLPERNLGNSGRFTYDYDGRYFFEFTYGYNGSEKFTGNKRFGFFPSFGTGWMISNESFWNSLRNSVSLLKLKFTYGKVGNDAIAGRAGRFFYLSDIRDGGSSYTFGKNFLNSYSAYTIARYGNPDIGWEESTKYNLGLELGLLKNEDLKFQIDVFRDIRDKIYWPRQSIPGTMGLEQGTSGNVGKVSSRGIDASLDLKHYFSNDFWLTGRMNFTYATNQVEEKDEPDYKDAYLSAIGQPVNKMWGLVAERLFIDQNEIDNSPSQSAYGTYMRGDIKYLDVNQDGVINDNDKIPMGYPSVPEIQYGFGISAGYRLLDFSFFMQGNARVSFFIDPSGIAPLVNRRNAPAIIANNSWSESHPDVHALWPRLSTTQVNNNLQASSWWLRDGSFVRLKSLEVGYTLPESIKKFARIGGRIYLSGENLFVISAFKLWDPEMGGQRSWLPA